MTTFRKLPKIRPRTAQQKMKSLGKRGKTAMESARDMKTVSFKENAA
jgi:hypothetical protein